VVVPGAEVVGVVPGAEVVGVVAGVEVVPGGLFLDRKSVMSDS
jgi:hypothetical protein